MENVKWGNCGNRKIYFACVWVLNFEFVCACEMQNAQEKRWMKNQMKMKTVLLSNSKRFSPNIVVFLLFPNLHFYIGRCAHALTPWNTHFPPHNGPTIFILRFVFLFFIICRFKKELKLSEWKKGNAWILLSFI